MSYCITSANNNGYRCGCCRRLDEHTEWADSRTDALEMVPASHKDQGEYELEWIEVRDGETGEIIAEGKLTWAGGRRHGYRPQRWFGHKDGVVFDEIIGAKEGETWEDVTKRIATEIADEAVKKAESELAAAQKKLEAARASVK